MSGRSVLIVDDNADSTLALILLLELQGFRCESAATAAQAIDAAAARSFDIALLDLTLPDGDGLALAKRLRATGAARRIVAVSGKVSAHDVAESLAGGFDAHVAKPVDFDLLLAAME